MSRTTDSLVGHWDQLRVFHVVAGVGSIHRAASVLNLHPSAVSRQIRNLEEALQTSLFERHAKGLKITAAGEALDRSVGDISLRIREVEAEIGNISDEGEQISGSLVLTSTFGFGAFWLIPRINAFLREHPQISMRVMLADSELSLDLHEVDIALRIIRPTLDGVIITKVGEYCDFFHASAEYLQENGVPSCVADLAQHRLILLRGDNVHLNRQLNWIHAVGLRPSDLHFPPFIVSNMHGVREAIRAGVGIGVLPSYLDPVGYERVLPDMRASLMPVYLVSSRTRCRLPRVRALREFIIEHAKLSLAGSVAA